MGIQIHAPDENAPPPKGTVLVLTCDAETDGLFPPARAVFKQDGFIEQHAAAMAAGWLERVTDNGRVFLCPDCSKKRKRLEDVSEGHSNGR
jgi:hypothetical protein